MFAVIRSGGKQYRVAENDVISLAKLEGEVGAKIALSDVLMLGGDAPKTGTPLISGASVEAEILELVGPADEQGVTAGPDLGDREAALGIDARPEVVPLARLRPVLARRGQDSPRSPGAAAIFQPNPARQRAGKNPVRSTITA